MERQYGRLDVSDVKRIKDLKHENSRLKRMYGGPVAGECCVQAGMLSGWSTEGCAGRCMQIATNGEANTVT